jgi:hypothetical protein
VNIDDMDDMEDINVLAEESISAPCTWRRPWRRDVAMDNK